MEFMTFKSIVSASNISFYAAHTLSQALSAMEEYKISSIVIVNENNALRVVLDKVCNKVDK